MTVFAHGRRPAVPRQVVRPARGGELDQWLGRVSDLCCRRRGVCRERGAAPVAQLPAVTLDWFRFFFWLAYASSAIYFQYKRAKT
jgi:hypothetical protein